MTQQISAAEFESKVLGASEPVLVDFFATWCGPCRMMAPTIDEVSQEMAGKASVYKLDIDESIQKHNQVRETDPQGSVSCCRRCLISQRY